MEAAFDCGTAESEGTVDRGAVELCTSADTCVEELYLASDI